MEDLETEVLEEPARPMLGRVAIVGYPNVGKSSLANRLSGTRQAIVHSKPGVTRDRKEIECEWNGERFMLIDTGGVDMGDPHAMARQITEQAEQAVAEADLVMLVVDAEAGISAADMELADLLRKRQARVVVVANKIDNHRNESKALEFHQLALGTPFAVSANHGNNTGDLLDDVVAQLREHGTPFRAQDSQVVKIAVLGRPNVGKSTLINAMLGSDRVIVSEVAGTTRDAIDTPFTYEDHELVLIDTAGIRRGKKEREDVEYYSEVRSLQAADRADVALVLVDSSQGVKEADLSIADQVRQRDCAMLVVLSKWDANDVDLADIQATITQKLRMRPEIVTSSGITGRNTGKIINKAIELFGRYSSRVSTGEFNRFLSELKEDHPPPLDKRSRRRLNLLYGTQYQTAPPRFRIFVNDRRLMTRSYGYYIENRVRERFGMEGIPVIIDYRSRD